MLSVAALAYLKVLSDDKRLVRDLGQFDLPYGVAAATAARQMIMER